MERNGGRGGKCIRLGVRLLVERSEGGGMGN